MVWEELQSGSRKLDDERNKFSHMYCVVVLEGIKAKLNMFAFCAAIFFRSGIVLPSKLG